MPLIRTISVSGSIPSITQLALGDLALNTYDGKAYLKKQQGNTQTILEIGSGGAASGVTQIIAGTNITISPVGGTGIVTINAGTPVSASYALSSSYAVSSSYAANGGVTQLLAGANITLAPTNGVGQVTISSTGGSGGSGNTSTGSYGSFYSTQTQTNVASTARSMSLNVTNITNGVSISGSTNPYNTYIKVQNPGVYDIQFSAQVDKTDSGTDEIWIWIRKNESDISDSATSVQLTGNGAHYVAAWNFFVNAAANDYFQLMWYSPDANVRLHAESAFGVVPSIPSLIVTANRVDQFLSNTGSFSGSFIGSHTGSFTGSFTGSLFGTSSFAVSSSRAVSSSYAFSSSYAPSIPFPYTGSAGISGSLAIKGGDTSASTEVFHVQTGDGTSIMDLRNNTYAFFGCGQGGGAASGFIFRYTDTNYTQFSGYNYGAGAGSYKPILLDTDDVGRSNGIFVNYSTATNTPPASTEFAVRGQGTTGASFTAKFQNNSLTDLLTITDSGLVGILNASPSYQLDVNGSARIVSDFYISDGNVNIGKNYLGVLPSALTRLQVLTPTSAGYPTLGTTGGSFFLAGDQTLYGTFMGVDTNSGNGWLQVMRNDSATAYNYILQPVGGKVGIGTTSPSTALEVSGDVTATTFIGAFTGSLFGTSSFASTASYWKPTGLTTTVTILGNPPPNNLNFVDGILVSVT